jgi:plastocyanin domain-containing protein
VSPTDWAVLALSAAAIAWVNWYFLFARRTAVRAARVAARQEQVIVVRGGYDPAVVSVEAGKPVRLVFDRQETSGCSEEVVIPALSTRKFLAPNAKTSVDLPPLTPGRYEFTCGMGMLRGAVIAELEGTSG